MSQTDKTGKHPEERLFEQLNLMRAGMLGLESSYSHVQPMAHMKDKDGPPRLWFFTARSGDLSRASGAGGRAHFGIVGKSQD